MRSYTLAAVAIVVVLIVVFFGMSEMTPATPEAGVGVTPPSTEPLPDPVPAPVPAPGG